MAIRADPGAARALPKIQGTEASPSANDARRDGWQRLAQMPIGKQLVGQVLSALDDGSHLVRLADTTVRMSLPSGVRTGESLPLTYVAREPRPTFLLDSRDASAPASLSATGRLIGQLLRTAEQEGSHAAVLTAAQPLLETPPAGGIDTQAMAGTLKDTVASSGLFYESHLQEWVNGQRSLEQIRQEPQARFATALTEAIGNTASPRKSAVIDADLLMSGQSAPPAIDPEAAILVSQQLHALEHQQWHWKGELMPGRPMEWEISRDAPDDRQTALVPEQQIWTSTVRFELPTLGPVSGTLRLVDGHVHIQLSAASEEAAAAMRSRSARLASALDAAGSPLDALLVKRDDSA